MTENLRRENEELRRRLAEAEQTIQALSAGQIDAVVDEAHGVPLLLREAQGALRESEQRYRQLFAANPHSMWVIDRETLRFLAVNDTAVASYGYSRDEFLSMTILDIRPPEDRERALVRAQSGPGGARSVGVWSHLRKDGSRIEAEVTTQDVDWEGRPARLVLAHDITERRRAEEQLRQAGAYARSLIETSLDPLVTISPEGTITDVNGATEEVTGLLRDRLIGTNFSDYFTEPKRAADGYRKVLGEGEVREYPLTIRHISGRTTDVLYNASVYRNEAGQVQGVFAAARDVSERKRAEEALRESEEELKEAQRVAHVGNWSWVIETDTVKWSEELFRMAGRDPAGPAPNYSRDHAALYTPESLARLQLLVERAIRTGESYEVDLELTRPDGTTRWVADTGEARRDAKGQIVGLHGTVEDITEKRRLQEQFLHAQKMEAVGQLAGGVAHDFNNLLTVILGYSDLLLDKLGPGHGVRNELLEVRKAADRAATLTRQLLAFSRKQTLVPENLDLGEVVRSVSAMVQRLIGEDIKVRIVVPPGLGRVEADRGQLEQVVMNLAVNARDAMPAGGNLVFELQNVDLDAAYAGAHAEVGPGRYVLLAISDTGAGMDAETQKRIFEPFFTTKEQGKGTGLGLSTVFGIVHQSGGSIGVYSEPGRGTTFKIYLPRTDGTVEAPRPASGLHPAVPAGAETILLVEDDDSIRGLAKIVLDASGYTVLIAGDPAEAERIASGHEGPIHLVLTDVVMPGMNGRVLAERLVRLRPDLRVLYMSGYTDDVIVHHGVLEAGASFLQKPFTPHQLTQKVREVLGSGPPGSR